MASRAANKQMDDKTVISIFTKYRNRQQRRSSKKNNGVDVKK